MTDQNNPLGQPPQEPVPAPAPAAVPPPAAQPPAQPAAPAAEQVPAAPQIPQQSFGEAPVAAGDATFGAAPGFPPPPAVDAPGYPPPPAGEAFGAPPVPVKKKSNVIKIVAAVGAVILAICIAGGAFAIKNALSSDKTKEAQTGDCIGNLPTVAEGEDKEANNAKVVDCTSADAGYKVEGRLEDKTEEQAKDENVCEAFPKADSWYRAIPPGGKGYVLCLSSVK